MLNSDGTYIDTQTGGTITATITATGQTSTQNITPNTSEGNFIYDTNTGLIIFDDADAGQVVELTANRLKIKVDATNLDFDSGYVYYIYTR